MSAFELRLTSAVSLTAEVLDRAKSAADDPAAEVRIVGACSGRYAYGGDCGSRLGAQVAVTAVVSASCVRHSGRLCSPWFGKWVAASEPMTVDLGE